MLRFCLLLCWILAANTAYAEPQNSVCRVHNRLAQFNNVGSGTLVDKSDDGREGLVLTCAHLFTEGVGQVVVEFPGGKSHGAKLVAIDHDADLAALAIANPESENAAVDFQWQQGERLRACGFGPEGSYACAEGPVVGDASHRGQVSLLVGDAVRSGDSGGGVFDSQGNLVAVVWGEAGGVTYASTGPPLRKFLDRVLGRRTAFVYACPNGMCPRPFSGGAVNPPRVRPPTQQPVSMPSVDMQILEELKRRIALVEQNKQDRGNYVTRGELGEFARAEDVARHDALFERVGAKPQAAVGLIELLGIAGPAGWGVVAATTVGGWLVGRLMKRGVGGRRGETFH